MIPPEPMDAYLMDLTAVLKALQATQQGAAQVGQQLQATQQAAAQVGHQLQERLQALQHLDGQIAPALTRAVQRATTALQQEQEHTLAQTTGAIQRQHATLMLQWQEVLARATRVQQWLPWKVAALLLGATLLVNAGVTAWWWGHQAADLQALRAQEELARGLSYHLTTKLYPQLSKAQQEELGAVYTAAGFRLVVPGRPAK